MAKVVMIVSTEGDEVVGVTFTSISSIRATLGRIRKQYNFDNIDELVDFSRMGFDFSTNQKIIESINRFYKQTYEELSDEYVYLKDAKTEASLVDTDSKSMENIKNFLEAL